MSIQFNYFGAASAHSRNPKSACGFIKYFYQKCAECLKERLI